jgi:molybdopterin synthase catalytic subunit
VSVEEYRICDEELDPIRVLDAVRDPACGAVASFLGTVRNRSDGKEVLGLEYEVHETMALRQFELLGRSLREAHEITGIVIHHRRGEVPVGAASVAIAVSAPRRRDALAACAAAIERLKRDVPIWKKETYRDGHRWIEGS